MAIRDETRKRLWGRSGNRCALCRAELVRPDENTGPGALVGQEAHIVARSPGGPRYFPLPIEERDGESNLLLLCANDHIEVDTQAERYTAALLRTVKRDHEAWVRERLSVPASGDGVGAAVTLAFEMTRGSTLWDLMDGAMAWQVGSPADLTEDEEDFVDGALQSVVDWGEISADVTLQGLRAVRAAKRSLQQVLDDLAESDLVLLAGARTDNFNGLRMQVAVLEVVRRAELDDRRVQASGRIDPPT